MDRFFFDRPNTMVKKVILVKSLSIKYILPFSSIPQLLLQYEEKFFQQVWNEKLLMFIYTQKCNFFFQLLDQFFSPRVFCAILDSVSSYAMRMLWMIWNTAVEQQNKDLYQTFNHNFFNERKFLPEPQTTKTNRPKSHGPTGEASSLAF